MSTARRHTLTLRWLLMSALWVSGAHAQDEMVGETISSDDIISQSLEMECVDLQVVGVCVWLTCTNFGCDISTSVQVHHYMPDLTVSSYADTGENPWTDVAELSQPTSELQDGGNNTEGSTVINETALRFKNVDVFGNPGIELLSQTLGSTDYFCESQATMFNPYFLSVYDPWWRDPLLETPLSVLNYFRTVGYGDAPLPLPMWGPVFPRIGLVLQGHDYKAGAVAAQRAANIVTQENQAHVYQSVIDDEALQQGYWPPGEAVEGDEETAKWQQLLPSENEAPTCHVFADINDQLSGPIDPFTKRINELTGYVWNVWRPYSCCSQEGAVLIFYNADAVPD